MTMDNVKILKGKKNKYYHNIYVTTRQQSKATCERKKTQPRAGQKNYKQNNRKPPK